MRKLIGLVKNRRSCGIAPLVLVLVFVLAGATLASNMGFKLNYGIISAINSLFRPHGYDREGGWTGEGSGVSFSLSLPEGESNAALLNFKTPPGTISLPYWYEVRRPRAAGRVRNAAPPVGGNPYMRYSGTNFSYDLKEPLKFASTDGVAQVFIWSKPEGNPMVRYSGTGFTMQSPAGPVECFVGPKEVSINIGEWQYTWTPSSEGGPWKLVE